MSDYSDYEDWRFTDEDDFYMPQYFYDWCIIQKCRYSEPMLVSCRLPNKESITVTEYSFGEYTYSISLDKVLMFGDKKGLSVKLRAYRDINKLSEKVKDSLQQGE